MKKRKSNILLITILTLSLLTSCDTLSGIVDNLSKKEDVISENPDNSNEIITNTEPSTSEQVATETTSQPIATATDVTVVASESDADSGNFENNNDAFADFDNNTPNPSNNVLSAETYELEGINMQIQTNFSGRRMDFKDADSEDFKVYYNLAGADFMIRATGIPITSGFMWDFTDWDLSGKKTDRNMYCVSIPNNGSTVDSFANDLKSFTDSFREFFDGFAKGLYVVQNDAVKSQIGGREFILAQSTFANKTYILHALTFTEDTVLAFSYEFKNTLNQEEEIATFMKVLESLE